MTDPHSSELLLERLRERLPDLRLTTDPADAEHYGRDWTRRWTPAPLAVALPASVDEVAAIVRWAVEEGVAVVPSGGRTGLSGGAVAANGELVLSLERMNRVLDFDRVDRTLTVQAGIALEAVHNAAREHGLVYPVDFAARGSCSIGGNIATNAGGIRVIRYGNTREWIAGLKVVTGTGDVLELNRALIKNSSGYDLRQLMIGSEGTLGIVVEATLRLTDPPPPTNVMLLALPSFETLMQVFAAFRERLTLEAFEFFTDRALHHVLAHGAQKPFDDVYPYYVVTEFAVGDEAREAAAMAAFEYCLEHGLVSDGVISQSDAQAAQLWRLREASPRAWRSTSRTRTTCRCGSRRCRRSSRKHSRCWPANTRSSRWCGSAISATGTCTSTCSSRTARTMRNSWSSASTSRDCCPKRWPDTAAAFRPSTGSGWSRNRICWGRARQRKSS